ncbi:MAG: gliding motility protein GldN [Bacteroidales bacterium]|nr:gliding motility protein GldN [Bacteroidales bacterium]
MKRILFLLSLVFITSSLFSQVPLNPYEKEHVPSRKPVPYPFLREADVMWSKKIVRTIPLREKINHPLYYPTKPIGPRMSLTSLLLYGINNEGLTAYDPQIDDNFTVPMTKIQINEALGAKRDTLRQYNETTLQEEVTVIDNEPQYEEVKRYLMKEEWFFEKQRSVMEVRIIGLTGIREFYREGDNEEVLLKKAFMIYFPEARRLFANHEVFNEKNDAERRTFEDIFFKRKFSSFVSSESNVFDDRTLSSFSVGVQTMLEAEKIKYWMFNFEHDLWEF